MSSTTTAARQLRRLAGVAALAAAMTAVPASALANGASGAAGAAAPSSAPKASGLLSHAKKVKPSGKAARAKSVGSIVIGGPDSAIGVFDEILRVYGWQRLPSGYWVRAVSVIHHANFGTESGYLWQYWNGSAPVTYALCLASTGCRAY